MIFFDTQKNYFHFVFEISLSGFLLDFFLRNQETFTVFLSFFIQMTGEDHFADFDEEATSQPMASSASSSSGGHFSASGGVSYAGGNDGRFANEIFTEKISAKMRTFFIDVKESSNGKFVKISEKSRGGQKSTIMMDAEDVPLFIEALQKAQKVL